ncbi:MAG: acetyl-CoA decarbonylase/synthase complex subunit delta [Methanobacteriota archaeon]|nr:MAG: acetyl-CoA decarbonylase/synthase complex subunit delta [Euryarchaeota archaeon]
MAIEIPKEKWTGRIGEVVIGATSDEGGTRKKKIVLGGENALPFLDFEGELPHPPIIGMEVLDVVREDYPQVALDPIQDVKDDPAKWAKNCEEEFGADLICLKLISTNPEEEDRSSEEAANTVKEVLGAVGVPLFIYGSGNEEKDAKTMELCSDAAKGERCFLGLAEEDAYKSISVASMANGHGVVAFSNLDINLAKQMSILLTDFGVKKENIIADPLMAALGYGLEYSYSVIERVKLAALMGDAMLQNPILCETTRVYNARESFKEDPALGDPKKRVVFWEATTGTSALMAGADMLIMRHPEAVGMVRNAINQLLGGES